MLKPDLIIVGASVRSLAESAIRDSLVPVCVDFFCDADLREALLTIPNAQFPDPLMIESYSEVPQRLSELERSIPVMLVGGAENNLDLARQLGQQRRVVGLSADQISALRDPSRVFPVLQAAGAYVPKFICGTEFAPSTDYGHDWLVKHQSSSGGQLVSHWEPNLSLVHGQFLQQRIDGICFSATFFVSANGNEQPEVWLEGIALQLSGLTELNCGGFQYCGNVGPIKVADSLKAQVLLAARSLMERWKLIGFFGIDFVLSGGRAFAIEVNPRLTASHELHETPENNGHVSRQLSNFSNCDIRVPAAEASRRAPVARFVVYASDDLRISAKQAAKLRNSTRRQLPTADCWIADIPASETDVCEGTPLCSVYLLLNKAASSTALKSILQLIPADTSKFGLELLSEIQGQIEVVQNV